MQCRECDSVLPAEARFCLSCGARVEPRAADSTVDPLFEALNKAIGFQYRIERLLGRGGMGAVYLAHELALDRDVAIKVLPPEQATTPQMRDRFRREARTAARLSHPNIVPLYTFGEVSGLVYFVMGYVAGESLASRLKRDGTFAPEETRALLVAIGDALDYAHRQGIVHRDIKPDNILIDSATGTPLLTDFGIAKPAIAEAQLTVTGQIIGTPHYMSPEQAEGRGDIDARSDVYSLGVVAYEMISGRRPFDAESPMEALTQRLMRDPKPLASAAPGIESDIALAVDRSLQRDLSKRWPDAKSMREALQPSYEETEDSLSGRMIRASVTLPAISIVLFTYLQIFRFLHPDIPVPRLMPLFLGPIFGGALLAVLGRKGLRSEGLDDRAILFKAFQQPRWWRSWYPSAFRRPGDVWNRLPPELRRFRLVRSFMQIYALGILLPFQLMSTNSPHASVVLTVAMLATASVGAVLVFRYRNRGEEYVRSKISVSQAETSALLTTSTWGVSTWRRAPISPLLTSQKQSSPRTAETTLAAKPAAEDATRL